MFQETESSGDNEEKDVSTPKKSTIQRIRKKSESSITKESTRVQARTANVTDSRKRSLGEKVETSGAMMKKAKASVPGKC